MNSTNNLEAKEPTKSSFFNNVKNKFSLAGGSHG